MYIYIHDICIYVYTYIYDIYIYAYTNTHKYVTCSSLAFSINTYRPWPTALGSAPGNQTYNEQRRIPVLIYMYMYIDIYNEYNL